MDRGSAGRPGRARRRSWAVAVLFAGTLGAVVPVFDGVLGGSERASVAEPVSVGIPFFTPSSATGSLSSLRVINRAKEAGTVGILAHDDTGLRHGPVTLDIGAGETVHLDAADLEAGNREKGLRDGIGTGIGAWRLELTSTLDIEVLSYARTQDGLVTGMQDAAPLSGSGYRVGLFNPAGALGQVSRLRLINPGGTAAAVTVEGIDDEGASPGGAVRLSLPARASRLLTAEALETGEGEGLSGALGDGAGRWRLVVTADRPVVAMNLLSHTGTGAMSNLSSGPVAATDGGDGATTVHAVGLFPSASNPELEGVLRVVNRTRHAGRVSIEAIDDTGAQYGPVSLRIGALEGLVIDSGDIEEGNPQKGLFAGTGGGSGHWRLRLRTTLDIGVWSYVRPLLAQNGLLSAMHDQLPRRAGGHRTTLFDPDRTPGQTGGLRLINPSATEADIVIRGVDGAGAVGGEVSLALAAGASRTVTVPELEGGTGTGLAGALGEGSGPWHLSVSANRRIRAMSLLSGPGGHLANLSAAPPGTVDLLGAAPEEPADMATAAEVFSRHVSGPVVQSRCIACHVEGGVSGNTRLVFERSANPDHEALNLEALATFLSEVEDGAPLVLNKIQGVSHGGGAPVPAGSAEFAQMERLLERLEGPPALFGRHVSEAVVQSRCIACHVEGGVSGNTRLVFAPSASPDHEALNLQALKTFLSEVEDGASLVLNKIQGVSHGGGEQVPAGSAEFAHMERLLAQLDAEVVPAAVTVATLFDPVRMAPLRKTLRRAALIFAGRVPTEEEYAAIYGGAAALRGTIRSMMTGPEFHEFLIRGANDRLLTNRMNPTFVIGADGHFVDFTNERYERKKLAHENNDFGPFYDWHNQIQHGFRRAPLELIAHVVENDLPYTEILTADYIMANPHAARAYGASTIFEDPDDWREFKPSKIASYYRKGEGFKDEWDDVVQAGRVIEPGPLSTQYPHAGILNTTSFLLRYPTTPTNRNRARARWTYYHFLGVDIEKSASRTMDPVALADTNNPTMHNPACTVCHSGMDPVAGAFQDYGDVGLYKDQWGGMDSLDEFYKEGDDGAALNVEASTWQDRQTLTWQLSLPAGSSNVRVTYTNPWYFGHGDAHRRGNVYLDRLHILDDRGRKVSTLEFEDLDPPLPPGEDWSAHCADKPYNPGTGREDYLRLNWGGSECALRIDIDVPTAGVYTAEIVAWSTGYEKRNGHDGYPRLSVVANEYEEGDTWYRDMRVPGINGEEAPEGRDSLQWLARKIVADPRFAEATVKFWWPAIMGREVAEPPAEEGDADFQGKLLAANAQSAEVRRLADGFRSGFRGGASYNLKDLLVEIVLSEWFRADALDDTDPTRRVALRHAGARRLLTPEELARKTASLTGFQWGRHVDTGCGGNCDALPNNLTGDLRLLYGGIDSDGITERARNMTSVMFGVAQRHAARTSCPVVMRELFLLPDEDRKLFSGIDKNVAPNQHRSIFFEVGASEGWNTYSWNIRLVEGFHAIRLSYTNKRKSDNVIRLDRLDIRDAASQIIQSYQFEDLDAASGCNHPVGDHFALHCGNGALDVLIEIPSTGNYNLEVIARGDTGTNIPPQLYIASLADTSSHNGSAATRHKLVELHDKLFGIQVTPYSPDVNAAFALFAAVTKSKSGSFGIDPYECGFHHDSLFLDGIRNADSNWTWNRMTRFIESIDYSDAHNVARAWVVVLAYLLTDYRYLYL